MEDESTTTARGLRGFLVSLIAPQSAGVFGLGDRLIYNSTRLVALFIVFVAMALVVMLVSESWQAMRVFGLGFITGQTWNPVTGVFSAGPTIVATLGKAFLALFLAVPIAVGTAIFIALYLPGWLRTPISYLVEGIAAIPSVIIGLWGLFVLVPYVIRPLQRWLRDNFGWIPIFDGPADIGFGILAGGVILALMITPIITAISRDLIRAVPQNQYEGMLALGSTKWEAIWRAILPYARVGIIGAIMLGLGRAIGETMAVTMVGGNAFHMPSSIFSPVHSMASQIAAEFLEAPDSLYISSLFLVGLLLVTITLIVNIMAQLLVWHITRGQRGSIVE